ncbi:MAG: MBOAT family protein, partial [Saprospiraceae bacterium]|nr:MBOAT family protein [Saprospiraceae bacterium]
MLFNSFEFLFFLPIVFLLYWNIRNRRAQNILLILASYFFYGWWDWRFLGLIIVSSTVDFVVGRLLFHSEGRRRLVLLLVSLLVNLGILGFFKYYNFFIDSFTALLDAVGLQANPSSLQV